MSQNTKTQDTPHHTPHHHTDTCRNVVLKLNQQSICWQLHYNVNLRTVCRKTVSQTTVMCFRHRVSSLTARDALHVEAPCAGYLESGFSDTKVGKLRVVLQMACAKRCSRIEHHQHVEWVVVANKDRIRPVLFEHESSLSSHIMASEPICDVRSEIRIVLS